MNNCNKLVNNGMIIRYISTIITFYFLSTQENINKVISEIPKEKYENIFKGAYERPEKYVPRNITRKVKKIYK